MFSHNFWNADEAVDIGPLEHIGGLPDSRHLSKSAMRALDVLELFARIQRPVRAVEVAEMLDLHRSSADQLLKTMVARAYLIFDVRRKLYHPSPRLLAFSSFVKTTYFGGERLESLMRHLRDKTRCSVALSAPFGRFMQLVDFILAPGQNYGGGHGLLFPIFGSAVGSSVLASWPIATVRNLIEESQDQLGGLASETILDRLRDVREDGHAFGGMSLYAEKCSIAVALPIAQFDTTLALTLRGSTDDISKRRWQLAATMHEAIIEYLGSHSQTELVSSTAK
jgi:DNA-binding IclR family transcriptional regulator